MAYGHSPIYDFQDYSLENLKLALALTDEVENLGFTLMSNAMRHAIQEEIKKKRACINCRFYLTKEQVKKNIIAEQEHHDISDEDIEESVQYAKGFCKEGGFSEIGDPHRAMTDEDCNAWKPISRDKIFKVTINPCTTEDEGLVEHCDRLQKMIYEGLEDSSVEVKKLV